MTYNRAPLHVPALLAVLFSLPVSAHEFWLAPLDYGIRVDQPLQSDMRIGQHFKGDTFPYRPSQVDTLRVQRADTVTDVPAKLGDLPAIRVAPLGDGLHMLTLSSTLFTVTYHEADKFPAFLRKEGLDWALQAHQERGLPTTGIVEAYRRHAKSLVKVGSGQGDDRRTGLAFEWVLLTNPYTNSAAPVAQLWWRDAVAANVQCRVFVRVGGRITEQVLHTDATGKVTLPRTPGATYLLNAVRIMVPDRPTVAETQAVWETRWASLTFATPDG